MVGGDPLLDQAEDLYKRAIAANPLHAYSLYNYALLLEDVRKDYDAAETVRPSGAVVAMDSLWPHVPHDCHANGVCPLWCCTVLLPPPLLPLVMYGTAQHFRLAIKADPSDSVVLADYAQFLKSVRKDYDKAQEFYLKSIRCDPANTTAMYNYANMLKHMYKDFDGAQQVHGTHVRVVVFGCWARTCVSCVVNPSSPLACH